MTIPIGTIGHGPWGLTPEGAAIHAGERTAVVADMHLGYEWARGASGDCVPAHSLDEALAMLVAVLARAPIARLVVAGDLVESARPCGRTAADLRRLGDWLGSRGVELVPLEGNHDRARRTVRRSADSPLARPAATCTVDGWTIGHGHRPVVGERTITGHFHPVLRAEGSAFRCFLAGPDRIILPAFSPNAAGCDVRTGPVPDDWLDPELRCIACAGSEWLDFGPVPDLRGRRGTSRGSASASGPAAPA